MLIYRRNALMTGKRTPTAKDYVQTGLVAMWDGIENAGWGVHDPNATTWKDLIGGIETSWLTDVADNSLTWENGGLRRVGTKGITATVDWCANITQTTPYTLEIVIGDASQTAPLSSLNFYYNSMANTMMFVRANYTGLWNSTGGQYASLASLGYDFPAVYFAFVATGVAGTNNRQLEDIYRDGTRLFANRLMSTSTDKTFHFFQYSRVWAETRDTTIHAVRLYSRALTADEIARNYNIDKARFGLP